MHNSHAGCGSDSALTVHCFAWNTTEVELKVDFCGLTPPPLCSVKPWSRSTKCCTYTPAAPWPSTAASCCVEPHAARGTSTEHTSKMGGVGGVQSEHTLTYNLRLSYTGTQTVANVASVRKVTTCSSGQRPVLYCTLTPKGWHHMILYWAETQPSVLSASVTVTVWLIHWRQEEDKRLKS